MEMFKHPYYVSNKRLLVAVGQWPDQSLKERIRGFCLVNAFMLTFGLVEAALIFTTYGELQGILDAIVPLCPILICFVKFYTISLNTNNIKQLFNRMIDNWNLWITQEELDIMHKFGKEGQMFTIGYTIYIYLCMTMFLALPFVPRFMDIIDPLNESRPLKPIFRSEYFIDPDEYFFFIYFHMGSSIVYGVTVLIATDTLFLLFNCHVCGVFAALGHYMESTVNMQPNSKSPLDYLPKRDCIRSIRYSVQVHKRALEFAELIESSYSVSLLQQAGLCLVCMSISLFQILMSLDKPLEAFRYMAFAAAQLVHLFCMCYPGQRMIDYSSDIQIKVYNGLWYKAPSEVSKLILLILHRSAEPTYLTAGKVFTFCLETFSTILQSSTSYFMVLASVN